MLSPFEYLSVPTDLSGQFRELSSAEARASRNGYLWTYAEFRLAATAFRVEMHWLPWRSFVRVEIIAHVSVPNNNLHSDLTHVVPR